MYSSPSQSNNEFDDFISEFGNMLSGLIQSNANFSTILGELIQEHHHGVQKTQLHQRVFALILSQPHIFHHSSSCIDIVFTSQPNFALDSDVHPSLHPIVTIILHNVSLISKLSIHHHSSVSFGILKNPLMIRLRKLFQEIIGIFCFLKRIFMIISLSLTRN